MMTTTTFLKNTFVLFGLVLLSSNLFANLVTQTSSGNWNDPGIWDMGVPGSSDDVSLNGGLTLTIPNGTMAEVKSFAIGANTVVTIEPTASLTVTGLNAGQNTQINVNGTLNINGSLAATQEFTLIVNGVVNITGNLSMTSDGTITVNSGGDMGLDGNLSGHDDLSITVEGNLDVDGNLSGLAGFNMNVSGTMGVNGSVSGLSGFMLTLNGSLSINGNLSALSGSSSTGSGNLDVNGSVSGPPAFTGGIVLPVTLRFFKANGRPDGVMLSWATETEINNDFYTLEKSFDGIQFRKLAFVEGAGNSLEPLSYSHLDKSPFAKTYYRLSQTDFDGTTTIFNTVEVTYRQTNEVKIFPTIIKDGTFFVSLNENTGYTEMTLFGQDGKLYMKRPVQAGVESFQIQEDLSAGIYFIQLVGEGAIVNTTKVIIR